MAGSRPEVTLQAYTPSRRTPLQGIIMSLLSRIDRLKLKDRGQVGVTSAPRVGKRVRDERECEIPSFRIVHFPGGLPPLCSAMRLALDLSRLAETYEGVINAEPRRRRVSSWNQRKMLVAFPNLPSSRLRKKNGRWRHSQLT